MRCRHVPNFRRGTQQAPVQVQTQIQTSGDRSDPAGLQLNPSRPNLTSPHQCASCRACNTPKMLAQCWRRVSR